MTNYPSLRAIRERMASCTPGQRNALDPKLKKFLLTTTSTAWAIATAWLLLLCVICACSTTTGNASKDRAARVTNAVATDVFNAALAFGLSEGKSALEGQNGQDAAQGAFLAASQSGLSSESLGRIVQAYAGPEVAQVAETQFAIAAPKTDSEKALIANSIGAAFQLAANELVK